MAMYNLARGGYAPEFGHSKGCSVDEHGLPTYLQPDKRSDGGYGYRDKIEWKQLMNTLEVRYGKFPEALQVGDQLLIFLQPNHASVKSLFVDFREQFDGFKFELKSLNGTNFSGKQTLTTYTDPVRKSVESVRAIETLDMSALENYTQWTLRPEDGYNPKVDAVVLEITALPKVVETLGEMQLLFARRFEQDGYMM